MTPYRRNRLGWRNLFFYRRMHTPIVQKDGVFKSLILVELKSRLRDLAVFALLARYPEGEWIQGFSSSPVR